MDYLSFWSKDQLTKKKDRILIKDPISSKWKYKTKEARLILQTGICIYFYISEGTAFLLQGLTYYEEVKLRRYNLKIKEQRAIGYYFGPITTSMVFVFNVHFFLI